VGYKTREFMVLGQGYLYKLDTHRLYHDCLEATSEKRDFRPKIKISKIQIAIIKASVDAYM